MKNQKRPVVVIDASVWVSYLITSSFAALADMVIERRCDLVYSDESIEELRETLEKPRLVKRIPTSISKEFLQGLTLAGERVVINSKVQACRDPKDDHVLALAVDAKADFIITGDKDLLVLKNFRGSAILPPAEFLRRFA
jgi:putative PIN family toxin of toxin-antitoxin system